MAQDGRVGRAGAAGAPGDGLPGGRARANAALDVQPRNHGEIVQRQTAVRGHHEAKQNNFFNYTFYYP